MSSFDALAHAIPGHAVDAREKVERFPGGQARIEGRGGGVEPEIAADGFGVGGDIMAHDGGAAGGGLQDGGEHAEGGGLAGAVGAEQAENLAGVALEIDALHRLDFARGFRRRRL